MCILVYDDVFCRSETYFNANYYYEDVGDGSSDVGKTVRNLDEKARAWHRTVLEKKNAMEKERRSRVISVVKKLDDIAREEVKSLQCKDGDSVKSSVDFHIPSIDLDDDDGQFSDSDDDEMV